MGTVNFFDKERNLIMQFKDFRFMTTEALNIVTFMGKVDFDFFHLETNFEVEEFDLKNLLLLLEKMHNREQKYITFNPLSGKIIIRLSEDDGQINVKGEIYNEMSTCKLEFKYDIDQSFIPDLIKEIEIVMKENA
jgi:hypothetical protein